jgi:hypothetical protein
MCSDEEHIERRKGKALVALGKPEAKEIFQL